MPEAAINGLKKSKPLMLIRMRSALGRPLTHLTNELAKRTINLALTASVPGDARRPDVLMCVPRGRGYEALAAARTAALRHGLNQPRALGPVFALTIYPRRGGFGLSALAQCLLLEKGIKPHVVCTSLAALVVVVDQYVVEKAVSCLSDGLNLPPGASPLDAGLSVVQSPPLVGA